MSDGDAKLINNNEFNSNDKKNKKRRFEKENNIKDIDIKFEEIIELRGRAMLSKKLGDEKAKEEKEIFKSNKNFAERVNELIVLELINHFVECLDSYFGNVCELDIIFNFQKSYYIIEEILCGGLIQETDRNEIQKLLSIQDMKLKEEIEEDYAPK